MSDHPTVRAHSCPNCGAKLRWIGEPTVIECRYCQTHVTVKTGSRTTQASEAVSQPSPRSTKLLIAIAIATGAVLLGAGGVMISGTARTSAPTVEPSHTSTLAALAATALAATPERLAKEHQVQAHGRTVTVALSDATWQSCDFSWDEAVPDHVSSIMLRPRTPEVMTAVVERLRAQLGRRLRPSNSTFQFSSGHGMLVAGTTLAVITNPRDNAGWKSSFAALWAVAKLAALGTGEPPDAITRRDLLGLGQPLTDLTQIGFDVPIDQAVAEIHRIAPSARSQGTDHTLEIDHPFIERASLGWENAAGGKWSSLTLYYPVELDFSASGPRIAACLDPVLGPPQKRITDHASGAYALQYPAKLGHPWVDVSGRALQIRPRYNFGVPATESGFFALVTAIAACTL